MSDAFLAVHFREMEVDEELRDELESRCRGLVSEFQEITHVELTLAPDGDGHVASGHARGRDTEVATHGSGEQPRHAADQVLDKLRHQLRRVHDKRIFARRRDAQKHHPKRRIES